MGKVVYIIPLEIPTRWISHVCLYLHLIKHSSKTLYDVIVAFFIVSSSNNIAQMPPMNSSCACVDWGCFIDFNSRAAYQSQHRQCTSSSFFDRGIGYWRRNNFRFRLWTWWPRGVTKRITAAFETHSNIMFAFQYVCVCLSVFLLRFFSPPLSYSLVRLH